MSLTADILSEIFTLLQASHHDVGGLPPHIVLSHVTQPWRTLALALPILWADIQVTPHSDLGALREVIFRSRDSELDINIIHPSRSIQRRCSQNFMKICDALSLITPLASRWHRLSISGDPIQDIMPLILSLRFPKLRCLELIQIGKSPASHFGPFNLDSSILTTLRLHQVTIHVSDRTQLEGLTSLEIGQTSCCMIDQASLDSLCTTNTLTHPPTMLLLRHLSISVAIPTFPLQSSFRPSSLVSLKFGGFHSSSPASVASLVHLFDATSSPSLKHLELDAILGFAWVAFVQSLQFTVIPKYPGLETLTLRSLELHNLDSDFASAFPAITRLTLVTVDPEPLHVLLRSDRSVWPALTVSVDIRGI